MTKEMWIVVIYITYTHMVFGNSLKLIREVIIFLELGLGESPLSPHALKVCFGMLEHSLQSVCRWHTNGSSISFRTGKGESYTILTIVCSQNVEFRAMFWLINIQNNGTA